MTPNKKLENIARFLGDLVSEDIDASNQYLSSEAINFEEISTTNLNLLKKSISSYKLDRGAKKSLSYQKLFEKFKNEVQGLHFKQINNLYPSLPQLAYRKFEEDKVSQEEVDDLLMDASFLSFLEQNFDAKS